MSIEPNFIHLRNHTEYSLCSGAIKLKQMIERAKEYHMPAVAITDTGNLFGALEFSCACKDKNIQAIVGAEILIDGVKYVSAKSQSLQSNLERENNLCKLILLAQNHEGYLNLLALVSESFLQRKTTLSPHITFEQLEKRNKGLIVLSGGVEGIVGKAILNSQIQKAEDAVAYFKHLFNNRFYIELMRHGLIEEIQTESKFIEFAQNYSVPLVATNNCYFLDKDMHEAQDILSCIADGKYVSQIDRKKLTSEHYFKSSEEMIALFADIPEAIENTIIIAQRCSIMAYQRPPTLPHFHLPEGVTEAEQMAKECKIGLEERLQQKFKSANIADSTEQAKIREEYQERMKYEIDVITQMDFCGYFLIVSDFIIWSKENDVPVGPGRGSGAGSVVAWAMKITDLDPIEFGLFFERFLNPERVSMPDFDVDFCQRGRGKVIEYVQKKYGKDMVAQIITFGKLQAKAVIKDVGRVLEMGYNEVDKISKMIPFGSTLEEAIEDDEDLQNQRMQDERIDKLLTNALKLEGLNRHASVHAAGVVIGDKPLQEICALYSDDDSGIPTVQYPMKYVDAVGLVKFDFLGLKTLTTIKDAINFIKQRGIELDINNLRLDDKPSYEMLKEGDSFGVFQIESLGMRSMLKQIKPDNIEDVMALISLYRPGPIEHIPTYIKRKHGLETIQYPHPKLENILKSTYGIMIYQEQVMETAKILAGYTLGGADLLRKAMGKKIQEEMDKQRVVFVEGCKKHNNIDREKANEIYDLLAKFVGYGFNRAHAASYSVISYQTAYLKRHYPVEFMTATINMDIHDDNKINQYLQDVKAHKIKILPPDVNKSDAYFKVEMIDGDISKSEMEKARVKKYELTTGKELAIRYGLGGVKGVGIGVSEELMAERAKNGRFADLFNFAERMGTKVINKKTIESLAKAGAFDNIHKNRRQVHDSCEVLSNYTVSQEKEKNSSQMSLLGGFEEFNAKNKPPLAKVDDWIGNERYQKEFEAFGFYLNNHPLDTIKKELQNRGITYIDELETNAIENNDKIRLAGVVIKTSIKSGPKGRYAYAQISDPTGLIEVGIFSNELITNNKNLLDDKENHQLVFECSIRKDEGGIRVSGNNFILLKDFIKKNPEGSLQKVTKGRRRFGDYKGDGNDAWKKKESTDAKTDIVYQSRQTPLRILKELTIRINNDKPMRELSLILNNCKRADAKEYTRIIIEVEEEGGVQKVDLGQGYVITEIEEKRIKETRGAKVIENR
jgi:DNA polymerase III subunit alpha